MKILHLNIKSIVVIMLAAMLLSCSNQISDVEKFSSDRDNVGMYGKDITMIYSDSLVVRYKIKAKEYIEHEGDEDDQYKEFPKGINVRSFDKSGAFEASIKAQYAKFFSKTEIWEARNAVEVENAEGRRLNTELLYWDMKKEIIYTDKYVRITTPDGQIIEGNQGFKSDQNMKNIELTKISGEIYLSDDK